MILPFIPRPLVLWQSILLASAISSLALADNSVLVRRQFKETDALFANPGQGWMSQMRKPSGNPRFPCSVVYIRFNWAEVEPEEKHYNWKLIDDVIEAWKPRHAAVAMRVMTCNAHSKDRDTSPKWLFDAGCRSHEYLQGGGDVTSGGARIPRLEPDYADPIFLEKHGAFLKAMGERYDGRPEVEFLDIGSYGVWGEWHTPNPAPPGIRKQIVDCYYAAFRKTPLVFMSDDAEILGHALKRGAGLRRDGVGSPWHEQNWIGSKKYAGVPEMAETWQRAPVVFEWFGNYDYLQSKQWSFDAAVAFMLANHVTLINDNVGKVPAEAMPQLEKLARLAGARFVLRAATYPERVKAGDSLVGKMDWANVGVGRLTRPYRFQFSLHDSSGNTVASSLSQVDPQSWLPGNHAMTEVLAIPASLATGQYSLAVALVDPHGPGQPFRLAFEAPETDGRREVGRVTVE